MVGIRYPMEVDLVGDAPRDAARAAAAACTARTTARGRSAIEDEVEDWWRLMEDRAHGGCEPDQPAARLLGAVAAPARQRILAADSGSAANWFARDLRLRRGMMASLSGTLATMGPGVPYAIAAKFAHPDRLADRARRRRRDADERHRTS